MRRGPAPWGSRPPPPTHRMTHDREHYVSTSARDSCEAMTPEGKESHPAEAAEAAIAPPSSAASAPRKKRAMVTWGAAHEAVLARIDESRRAQVGSQLWAGARAAAANIRRQVGAGAGGKRAAEWPAGDADARAQVRRRVGDSGGSSIDMIL